jgi:hypothetical protein
VDRWAELISETVKTLWGLAEETAGGGRGKEQKDKLDGLRPGFIRVMQYFARMVSIALVCTGHMRSEDWYHMVCVCVFGADLDEDNIQKLTASADLSHIIVPGCSFRQLVWYLKDILEKHEEWSKNEECCLSGVLCVVDGVQMKKLKASAGEKNANAHADDPDLKYNLNVLVDGEWGAASAGNVMVIARGLLELYNGITLTLKKPPVTFRSVLEVVQSIKKTRTSNDEEPRDKKQGGKSYISEALRHTLAVYDQCCSVRTGLQVDVITSIKPEVKKHA